MVSNLAFEELLQRIAQIVNNPFLHSELLVPRSEAEQVAAQHMHSPLADSALHQGNLASLVDAHSEVGSRCRCCGQTLPIR